MTAPARTSVVLPFRNRRATIMARCGAILGVLGPLDELLAVDDGSIDGGAAMLRDMACADPRLRVIQLRRSFGQTAALAAGFDRASGDLVVTIDADQQTDPGDIALLRAAIDVGADVVSGRRDVPRSLPTRVGNAIISRVTGVALHDFGCPLKAYRADVLREMHLYGDMYRFAPAVATWHGAQVAEVMVREMPGHHIPPGAGLRRIVRVLIDLATVAFLRSYRARPMQAIGRFAGLLLALALLTSAYLAYLKLWLGEDIGQRVLTVLAVMAVMLAAQFLVTGLLAELAVRVYFESQGKPIYVVREEINAVADPPRDAIMGIVEPEIDRDE